MTSKWGKSKTKWDTSRSYFKNALLKRKIQNNLYTCCLIISSSQGGNCRKFQSFKLQSGHSSSWTPLFTDSLLSPKERAGFVQLTLMIPLRGSFLFQVNVAVEEEIIEERQPGTEVKIEPENRNNNSPEVVGNYHDRPQSQTVGVPEVIVRPRPEDERSTQFWTIVSR